MSRRHLAAFLLLLPCGNTLAGSADDYAYAWPLNASADSAAWQVDLTPEVYAALHDPLLRDLDVLDGAGHAVPIAARFAEAAPPTLEELELPLFVLPAAPTANADESLRLHIERDANGRLRRLDTDIAAAPADGIAHGDLLVDASALKQPIDSLWLSWDDDSATVAAQYSVSGSDDLQQWRVLNSNASVLAMHQNGNALSRREIALNGARATYLRLHRLDTQPELAHLHVRARTLAHADLVQPARRWLDAPLTPVSGDAPIVFRYRLPAVLPIEALRLELASDNSLARVRVANRVRPGDDAAAWQTRAEFTAFRLRQGDSVISGDEQRIGAVRAQDWRVDATTGLEQAPTLRVAFRPDRFVFLTQGSGPYRLAAGSVRAHHGDYPVDAALAQLRAKLGSDWQPPLAVLGSRVALQGERALTAAPPPADWKTWLLWGVMIAAAALIGALALSLLRTQKA